jgi:fructose-1,6-bisphosphatase II / sedoheptulose-1,7-bisphosphatase
VIIAVTAGACEGSAWATLAAAALRSIGGQMQGRLLFDDDGQRERARRMGIEDLNRKYQLEDMARGDVMFAATGVTDGSMLRGVRRFPGGATTHSIVMRSKTGTVRVVEAQHNFNRKTWMGSAE